MPDEVLPYTHTDFIKSLNSVYSNFVDNTSSSNRYIELVNNIHDAVLPFGTNGIQQKIYDVNVGSHITAIIESNESFNSYVFGDDRQISNYLFLQKDICQKHIIRNLVGYRMTLMKDILTKSDNISIKGFNTSI